MKTLYISDLDGTLLSSDAVVTEKSADMLGEAIKRGLLFTAATARTYSTVIPMFKSVELSLPLVLMNGVCIFDPKERKAVDFRTISPDTGRDLLEIFSRYGKYPMLYYDERDHITVEYKELQTQSQKDYVSLRTQFYNKHFKKVENFDLSDERNLVYCVSLDKKEELEGIFRRVNGRDDVDCHFYPDSYNDEYFLEIFQKNISKASAALKVKEMVGADRIVAFGDNTNDIPLFQIADECYAVANACDELKSIATGIIGTNDEDSVAGFLLERSKNGDI